MSSRVSFWLLIALIAGVGVGKAVQSDTLDPDLFWHLRVAEQLRSDGIGPIVDRISFSSIKEPWTPYSWLAELGMKWMWDHCGWRAAVAGEALLVACVIALISLCCLELAGPQRRLNCVLGTALGAFLTIPFLSFRPITFAILLLAVCAWLLLRDRRQRSHLVWLTVPLTALTANVHLVAIVVPIWVACLLAGAIWERKDIKRYAILLAAASLACLATPMLRGAARAAWFYQAQDVMVASGLIEEMKPVYKSVLGIVEIAAMLLLIAFSFRKVRVGEWLWLIAATAMFARLPKFSPMLALIAAPVLSVTFPALSDRVLRKPILAATLAIALSVALVRVALSFPRADTPMNAWVNRRLAAYPTAAADYVDRNVPPRRGRIINEFNWGGYLAWRLGERWQVFLDERTQLYTPQFWRATYLGNDEDIAAILREAGGDVAIIPVGKSRFRKALESLGWRSVYRDEIAEVWMPA